MNERRSCTDRDRESERRVDLGDMTEVVAISVMVVIVLRGEANILHHT